MPEEPTSAGETLSDEEAMRRAIDQARLATARGDVPIGAIGLVGGRIVASAHNQREQHGDPTAHAEMLLLREVAAASAGWRLSDLTVVVTLEPCAMCAGALVAARVRRLVYGATDPKAGAVGSLYNLCADPRLNHEVTVRHGVLAEECGALLVDFFAERRGAAGSR